QEEVQLGKRLLALAEEETEVIIANDLSRLAALKLEQRHCVERQAALEAVRQSATRDLACATGMDQVPTLNSLLATLPVHDQETLSQLRVHLLEIQGRLDLLNARNRQLLENALDYVRFSLDAITTAALQPARYGTNLAQLSTPAFYID